jgi:hypothetical protein
MGNDDVTPPVADDDFAEFAAPPQQRPGPAKAAKPAEARPPESEQDSVDDVLARLRRERAEGKR